ncbi:uncharacterized protein HMPREF1541_11007 [Cyphellophora europaea CBS 101466]|uniref:Uncharacterized protein n=1 Tax=Cyphellophora europaea (strain CBS 101466) TaxID=1220924 RepID=W2S5B5_CYPE1|nr:uncharacterized protein HMPREF1541_11007 [Cyphellophora europaea CBS 101466]ETN43876.1 hypothetical protein HMPREF1541_11007 [Cyphellophora europaea CBS 101466]
MCIFYLGYHANCPSHPPGFSHRGGCNKTIFHVLGAHAQRDLLHHIRQKARPNESPEVREWLKYITSRQRYRGIAWSEIRDLPQKAQIDAVKPCNSSKCDPDLWDLVETLPAQEQARHRRGKYTEYCSVCAPQVPAAKRMWENLPVRVSLWMLPNFKPNERSLTSMGYKQERTRAHSEWVAPESNWVTRAASSVGGESASSASTEVSGSKASPHPSPRPRNRRRSSSKVLETMDTLMEEGQGSGGGDAPGGDDRRSRNKDPRPRQQGCDSASSGLTAAEMTGHGRSEYSALGQPGRAQMAESESESGTTGSTFGSSVFGDDGEDDDSTEIHDSESEHRRQTQFDRRHGRYC